MALQKCHVYMQKYYEQIRIRKSCLDIDEKHLFETINLLEQYKSQLDQLRKNAESDLADVDSQLVDRVKALFQGAVSEGEKLVNESLDDNSAHYRASYWKKLLHGKNVLRFDTKKDADVFFETFHNSVKEISANIMHILSRDINDDINRMCYAFRKRLQSKTNDICESIGMRLKLLFGFEVIPLKTSSNTLNMNHLSRALTETDVTVRRRVWYLLWIFKTAHTVKINQLTKKQLEENAIDWLKENFKKLEEPAFSEVKNRANGEYNSHFDLIETYLSKQTQNILTAITDKKTKREDIEKKFDSALNELHESKETIQQMLTKIKIYFKD